MEARVIFVIMGTSPYEDPPPAKLRASKGGTISLGSFVWNRRVTFYRRHTWMDRGEIPRKQLHSNVNYGIVRFDRGLLLLPRTFRGGGGGSRFQNGNDGRATAPTLFSHLSGQRLSSRKLKAVRRTATPSRRDNRFIIPPLLRFENGAKFSCLS